MATKLVKTDLDFEGNGKVTGLPSPTAGSDAVNKTYVDSLPINSVFNDSLFTLQDDLDPTKQARFQLAGITTGNTLTYTLPGAVAGGYNLCATTTGHTISATWVFSSGNNSFGISTATGTTGLATGATVSGATKTLNIGTGGAAGSTTTVNIGPTLGTGTITVNAGVTSFSITDTSFTLRNTADPSKTVKFDTSGVSTGTNRTMTIPNASGTLALAGDPLPFANLTGKPSTLAGYGINDAVMQTGAQTIGGVKTLTNELGLPVLASDPAAPASGLLAYSKSVSGMIAPKVVGAGNHPVALQNALWDRRWCMWRPSSYNGTWTSIDGVISGNVLYLAPATTNAYTLTYRSFFGNVATTLNQTLGIRNFIQVCRGAVSGVGGFYFYARAGFEVWTNGGRMAVGPGPGSNAVSADPSSNNPDAMYFIIDSADNGLISFYTRNGYGAATKTSTGLTAASGKGYDFYIFCEPGDTKIQWLIREVVSGVEASGVATTNLPDPLVMKNPQVLAGNAALTTASAITFSIAALYCEVL
jgi:hypothetical protein